MTNRLTTESLRLLLGAACVVIISWGLKAASDLLSPFLLGLVLAYSGLPFVKWLRRKFHLRKASALSLAAGLMGTLQVVLVILLYENVARVKEKLPIYQERALSLYQHITVLLQSHGIDVTRLTATKVSTSNEMVRIAQAILPQASRILSDALVVVLLGWLLLSTIAEEKASAGSTMSGIQNDVALYIGTSATSGALGALANLVVLVAIGVDFPLIWCVLYFFLNFIPSIGFIFAMVPPSCLALVMLGWERALLVVAGFALTQLISAYAITPTLLKKRGVGVSFLEMMLSVSWWGFLLGPTGSLLAIPLTLAMKRVIPAFFSEKGLGVVPRA